MHQQSPRTTRWGPVSGAAEKPGEDRDRNQRIRPGEQVRAALSDEQSSQAI